MNNSNTNITIFDEILNEKQCYAMARQCKFIQRSTSRLNGHEFIKALILPSSGGTESSLSRLCLKIREFNPDANISCQALCERINSAAAPDLLKGVFSQLLQYSRSQIIANDPKLEKLSQLFPNILLEDSSAITLHPSLAYKYEGTNRGGRSGMRSQVKIDLIHNIGKGCIVDVSLHSGKDPDQGIARRILSFVRKGDLVIRDLGYFVLDVFQKFNEMGVYFISRLQPNVKVFLKSNDTIPLDLGAYIKKRFKKTAIIEFDGFLGDKKIPARIVLYKVPPDIANRRLREAHKRAKETGRTLSKSKETLTIYSIFVTNIPSDVLPVELIGTVYRLRWEIELIFKQWKSQLRINHLEGINPNRIDTLIWGRLCMVVICAFECAWFKEFATKHCKVELSEVKLINYFIRGNALINAIACNQTGKFFKQVEQDIPRMLAKDKRQRKTMREKINTSESYYEMIECHYVS